MTSGMTVSETRASDRPEDAQSALETLVDRFDPEVFDVGRKQARIRLEGAGPDPLDVLIEGGRARLESAAGEPDAELLADAQSWEALANDLRDGMAAFRS